MLAPVRDLVEALNGKSITIIGHNNIDVDASLSGILMSKLLDFLGIENQFCILEPVQKGETYEIIMNILGIDIKNWEKLEEREDRNIFLVDHYETTHSGKVIGCIDHHPTSKNLSYKFKYIKRSCATAYLIYKFMKEVEYPITEEEAKIIIVAMMVDTTCFKSSKTVKSEEEETKVLAQKYNLDYQSLEKICLCLTPIENLKDDEIISNGQKWYNYNGNKVGSSYLQLYELPEKEQLNKWIDMLKRKLKETSSKMLVFIIFALKDSKTYEYQIMYNSVKRIEHSVILSRGTNIMPKIEQRFLNGE